MKIKNADDMRKGDYFERSVILLQDCPEVLTELLKHLKLSVIVRSTQSTYGVNQHYVIKPSRKKKRKKATR